MAKPKESKKVVLIVVGSLISLCVLCSIGSIYLFKQIGNGLDTHDTNQTEDEGITNDSNGDVTNNNVIEEEGSPISYNTDTDSGNLWVGSIVEKKFEQGMKMHATYTYKFTFELNDPTQTITKVVISDISASTSLPGGDLKILPYMHVSRSENGGSVPSTAMYEDWNTYGYTYITDFSKMSSLSGTYSPKLCSEDIYCDYLDEVGQKGGSMSLRFKYVGVGNTITERTEYQAVYVTKAHGVSASQLSGDFSWTLQVTLSDGTVETHSYSSTVDGTSLDLASSNTIGLEL